LLASAQESKLFIGLLSRTAGEDEIRGLFEKFGEIKEIHMLRNADGSSKCSAFLRFVARDAAYSAIANLNGLVTMEGSTRPLIVRFADNNKERQQRQIMKVRRQEMMTLPPGAYPQYHTQMVPPMGLHPGAAPQTVYTMSPQHYSTDTGYPSTGQAHLSPAYMYPHHQYGHVTPYGYVNQQPRPDIIQSQAARPREGPSGANLFVYHLPHDLTDADLATAFNPFGNVISAKVYVDKYTGESKGFGKFIWSTILAAFNVHFLTHCSHYDRICFLRFSRCCKCGH
jgi:CUG-BP- and ETR3-like factor